MKIYYKVCAVENRALNLWKSTNVNSEVIYNLNKYVKPKIEGSYLCVFTSSKEAKKFSCGDYCIFKCHAKVVKKPIELRASFSFGVDQYWTLYREAKRLKINIKDYILKKACFSVTSSWPNGTLWAKEVKILEQIN